MTSARGLAPVLATLASLALAAPAGAQLVGSDPAGIVVGASGDVVGTVDSTTGTVVDATGDVVATLDPVTGELVDATGEVIGTVDPVTGTIVDTAGNVVGTVVPGGGAAPGGTPGTGLPGAGQPGATLPGSAPSALRASVSSPSVQRFRLARRRGVVATSRCSAACAVLLALTVDRRTARRLRLGPSGGGRVVIGTASAGRDGRLAVRLAPRARRALDRYLPSARALRALRSAEGRARRDARAARSPAARRRAARRVAALRAERRALARRSVVVTLRSLAFDGAGGAVAPRSRTIRLR